MSASAATENDNKAFIRYWLEEVWNKGREELIEELSTPDVPASGLAEGNREIRGHDMFKAFYRTLRGTLPDIHVKVEDVVAEGDMVAVRLWVEGS